MTKEPEKISRKLNNILIDRIRKYQSQDISQLLNSPMDEDSNNSYLGGLINFVGDDTNNLDDEITIPANSFMIVEVKNYNNYFDLSENIKKKKNILNSIGFPVDKFFFVGILRNLDEERKKKDN